MTDREEKPSNLNFHFQGWHYEAYQRCGSQAGARARCRTRGASRLAGARSAQARVSAACACMTCANPPPAKPSWQARACRLSADPWPPAAPHDRRLRPSCRRTSRRDGREGWCDNLESDDHGGTCGGDYPDSQSRPLIWIVFWAHSRFPSLRVADEGPEPIPGEPNQCRYWKKSLQDLLLSSLLPWALGYFEESSVRNSASLLRLNKAPLAENTGSRSLRSRSR